MTSLRYLMVACVQVPVRKLRERLPTAWAYLIKLFLLPLSVSLSVCLCIEFCPSQATKARPISRATASVEAPSLRLHSPLLASKAVLSSWSLVVICALITTDVTGITGWYQAGTRLVPRTIYEGIVYMYENIRVCTGTRGSPVAFLSYDVNHTTYVV